MTQLSKKIAQFFQSGNYELAKQLCLSVGISEAKARLYERFYKAKALLMGMPEDELLDFDSDMPCLKCFRYAGDTKEYDYSLPIEDIKCPIIQFVLRRVLGSRVLNPPKELAYLNVTRKKVTCDRFVGLDSADTITEAGPNQLPLFELQ